MSLGKERCSSENRGFILKAQGHGDLQELVFPGTSSCSSSDIGWWWLWVSPSPCPTLSLFSWKGSRSCLVSLLRSNGQDNQDSWFGCTLQRMQSCLVVSDEVEEHSPTFHRTSPTLELVPSHHLKKLFIYFLPILWEESGKSQGCALNSVLLGYCYHCHCA